MGLCMKVAGISGEIRETEAGEGLIGTTPILLP